MHVFKLAALLLSLTLAACGGSSTPATSPTSPTTAAASPGDASCPAAVPGTSVTVEDAPNGAALVFVTTGDVAELRRRAAAMAQMHNDHHAAMGPLPDGTDAGGGHAGHDSDAHAGHGAAAHAGHDAHAGHGGDAHAGHDMAGHAGHGGGMIGIHSRASASDVEGGAKITFVAGGADVAKLQGELRMHAQHFAAGTCTMGKMGKS